MKQQATPEEIKSKIKLVLVSYPTQGVEPQLLITIAREFLKDDSLVAARSEIQVVIDLMDIPKRKRGKEIRYFATAPQLEAYNHGQVIPG